MSQVANYKLQFKMLIALYSCVFQYLLFMVYTVSYTKNATGIRKETSQVMEDNIIMGYMRLRQVTCID